MPNTEAGGIKYRETMIRKHGSEENWKAAMRALAAKGGQARVPKGFGVNPELASRAGAIGGKISKRGPSRISRRAERTE